MKDGVIIKKAAVEIKGSRKTWLIVIGVCLLIMGLNYGYFLNMASGPKDVAAINLDAPGTNNYATATGKFSPIGSNNVAIQAFGQTADTGESLGTYYAFPHEGRLLLIYSDKPDMGESITGKLEPLDEELQQLVGDSGEFYAYMLSDYVSYAWSMNLPLLIAIFLLPIAILVFLVKSIKVGNPYEHKQIAKLKAVGDPFEVIKSIETNNTSPEGLPILTTEDWFVVIKDKLRIYKLDDIDGYGTPNQSRIFSIIFFVKGNLVADNVFLPKGSVEAVLQRLKEIMPEKQVTNLEDFKKTWNP